MDLPECSLTHLCLAAHFPKYHGLPFIQLFLLPTYFNLDILGRKLRIKISQNFIKVLCEQHDGRWKEIQRYIKQSAALKELTI